MTENNLVSFKAIADFTKELAEIFSSKQRSLKLYSHLVQKTTIAHDVAIQKHVAAFKQFSVINRNGLLEKDESKFIDPIIKYSERVYINLEQIFRWADNSTKSSIWQHLLLISALVDPAGKAKEILKKHAETSGDDGETDFLVDIMSKVEQHVDPESQDPMAALSGLLSSGVLPELVGNLQQKMADGSLDMGKLMGSVQGMISGMSEDMDPDSMNEINSMVGNMMSGVGGLGGESGGNSSGPPDMSNMLSMLTSTMSGMDMGQSGSVEEQIQKQLEDSKNKIEK